jgi:hypothetical protein
MRILVEYLNGVGRRADSIELLVMTFMLSKELYGFSYPSSSAFSLVMDESIIQ